MRESVISRGVRLGLAGVLLIVPIAVPGAQRRGADNGGEGAPVGTNAIVRNPDAYYGKPVTVSASVERVLSKTTFVLDQRRAIKGEGVKAFGAPILVIAPYLTGALTPKDTLVVRGEIAKFERTALARMVPEDTLDLPPEIGVVYEGQPVLVARSVRDARFVEMGMKPVRPPRPEEVSMATAMKTVSAAFADLNSAAQDSNVETVKQNAAKLQTALIEIEAIWTGLGQKSAAALAAEARTHAAAIERAAAGATWSAVKTSSTALEQSCQNCHRVYREPQEDGTFRFKAAS